MMCLKSACPQCLVRAECAVVNHYAGDFEMYIYVQRKFRSQKADNMDRGQAEKRRVEERKRKS